MQKIAAGIAAVAATTALFFPASAAAQNASDEILHRQIKDGSADGVGASTPRGFVVPPRTDGEHYGYRVELAGVYKPTSASFSNETWIYVTCTRADPRVAWDRKFGSSRIRVHAFVYDLDADGDLRQRLNTADTRAVDEAVCNLAFPVDTSFIEVPRSWDVAAVSLFSFPPGGTQKVEAVSVTDRSIPLP